MTAKDHDAYIDKLIAKADELEIRRKMTHKTCKELDNLMMIVRKSIRTAFRAKNKDQEETP